MPVIRFCEICSTEFKAKPAARGRFCSRQCANRGEMRPKPRASVGDDFLRSLIGADPGECIAWPFYTAPDGYGRVKVDGAMRVASHRMCELAHGRPTPPREQAAHSCGNPACVNPNHLRWATRIENAGDCIAHGTRLRGERQASARLTAEDVLAIRGASTPLKALAERYGVSTTTIEKVRSGKSWRHIL